MTALRSPCFTKPLRIASKQVIQRRPDSKKRGGRYETALQAASADGLVDIVELLLANGAKVNSQGGLYGSALQAA